MRTLSTGVEIIDESLGGITPGLPCVIAGPSGSGRTVLGLQVASASLEQGRIVTMMCNEPAPFLLQQASALGFRLEPHLASGRFALLEMDADIGATTAAIGIEPLIEALVTEQPLTSTLVIDPLSVLTAGIFDESHLRSLARTLVSATAECACVLTVESERLALQQGLERVLGEISGSFVRLGKEPEGARTFNIEKTRTGVNGSGHQAFRITRGGAVLIADPTPAPDAPVDRFSDAAACEPAEPDRVVVEPTPLPSPAVSLRARDHAAEPTAGEIVPARERPVILLVDSDRQSRDLMHKWLDARYEVITADDGFQAMTWMMTEQPDLVVLDLLMPRVTGYELLSAFQRTSLHVPRLVISGRIKRPGDRLAPLVLGATDVLPKPVERIEFMHKIELLLRLQSSPEQMMDPADAETLFATISKSRQLDHEAFSLRLDRACNLGERLGLPSSLIALSSHSAPTLDLLLEVLDDTLRFEDATLRVSPRRAAILLVATEPADAPTAIERMYGALEAAGGNTEHLSARINQTERLGGEYDWHLQFRSDADEVDAEAPGDGDDTKKRRRRRRAKAEQGEEL